MNFDIRYKCHVAQCDRGGHWTGFEWCSLHQRVSGRSTKGAPGFKSIEMAMKLYIWSFYFGMHSWKIEGSGLTKKINKFERKCFQCTSLHPSWFQSERKSGPLVYRFMWQKKKENPPMVQKEMSLMLYAITRQQLKILIKIKKRSRKYSTMHKSLALYFLVLTLL